MYSFMRKGRESRFPMNTSMVASLSTQKPLLAATMRKAISYP
jgi:hypothetical protein